MASDGEVSDGEVLLRGPMKVIIMLRQSLLAIEWFCYWCYMVYNDSISSKLAGITNL